MPASSSTPELVELCEARLSRRERETLALVERMEAALTRIENALGLPPWGEEAKPKAALRLLDSGHDG